MTTEHEYSRSKLFFGLILIAIGCAYSLDELDYFEAGNLWRLAPLVLVGIGLNKLWTPISRASLLIGWALVFVGAFLLAGNFGLIDLGFWDLFPLVPVAIGLRLIFGPPREKSLDSFHTVSAFTMMGGVARGNNSAHFRGGDLVAVMGGTDFDLREARITEGPAVIDTFAFWGGIDIKVPEDWIVTIQGIPLLGTFEDETRRRRPVSDATEGLSASDTRQELIIRGFAVMGGVGVKN